MSYIMYIHDFDTLRELANVLARESAYRPNLPRPWAYSSYAEGPFLPDPEQPTIEMDWQRLYKPTVDRIREFHQQHPEIDTDRLINDILYHGLEKYEHDSSGTTIQPS